PTASLIWEMPGSSCVRADDEGAGYALTRRLLALGHRHFLQLTFLLPYSKTMEPQNYRIAGARRALAEAGLDPDRHLLLADMSNFNWLNPAHIDSDQPELAQVWVGDRVLPLVDVLRAHPAITAIFGLNDASALRAWRLLEGAGYRVPADYSIVGFDDTTPRLDAAGANQLSSARVPLQEIGRAAATLIIEQATAAVPRAPAELVLPVAMAFRGSVGPARG
ncbi:MAG TPA: substrate-binding domain-containing protein, partial [Armatimonadota bacterium]|nr:substrate-binding domain-containing protein [Armatimonadota bacterium]